MSQLRFSGSGGQGVITAAIIFAEAAIEEGRNAVQSQSYGPEARGGASKAEVIISDETIYHTKVMSPDFVMALTQLAADKYYTDLKDDGILLLDEDLVPNPPPFKHIVRIPITKLASEKVGKTLYANMVALGAAVRLTGIASLDTIEKCVSERVPKATIEANMKALEVGYEAAGKCA